MPVFTDQMGRQLSLPQTPRRIISLVPSQTELLCHLGLSGQLVGITKFCVHPTPVFKATEKIGGTKNLKIDKIVSLRPDLIIGNKEENEQSQIEELSAAFPVWMSDVRDLADALEMIRAVGQLTGQNEAARQLTGELERSFKSLKANIETGRKPKTAYFIWRRPMMAVGGATFIDDMLQKAGFLNVFGARKRYPEISKEELRAADPDLILLSSEPYPFKDRHLREFQDICPKAVIKLVDGELFSWYGSRLRYSVRYFLKLRAEI